jgi:hypothetical protein
MGLAKMVIATAKRAARAILASEVRTHVPAQVVSYNPATNTVVVQPCINVMRTEDPNNLHTVQLPQIADVPVRQFGSGTLVFTVPPIANSFGLLHVNDRELETWMTQGGIVDPASSRKFDLTDAVFEPGLYPLTAPFVPPVNTDRIEMRTSIGTSYVSVVSDGSVEITAMSLGLATFAANGTITLENAAGSIEISAAGTVSVNGSNLTVLP